MNAEHPYSKFYLRTLRERQSIVAETTDLTPEERQLLLNGGGLQLDLADLMSENVIGTFGLPFALAVNFVIDGTPRVLPFVTEEASVVAAASKAAKLSEGFTTDVDEPIMIGQLQIVKCRDPEQSLQSLLDNKVELLRELLNSDLPLKAFGGGPRDLHGEVLETERGRMIVLHLLVDVRDAMGANAINTILETFAPQVQKIIDGEVRLRILSNLSTYRIARAKTVWRRETLGAETIDGVLDAYAFAQASPYRAVTHNKGVMNGIDAVALATGNDFRALEACAHAYACLVNDGKYRSLTEFSTDDQGDLCGRIEVPLGVGTVGGSTRINPMARLALKILGVRSSRELAGIMASAGLAQNFAALLSLATEGIQRGHMRLHSKSIALMAGAIGEEIEKISLRMIQEDKISLHNAENFLALLRRMSGEPGE
ncbi:MAG: hydroxymethylglutaryl-CoA reductase, degradative [Deltaproteobacteria bacterium RIFOXYA12_FULL_61_11]|nr:MAG: hydroxymethylglutaryl-CoA reductase, degradative [Deltaproteobacteria bacterium RIFOXYA12_FULL_61_11]